MTTRIRRTLVANSLAIAASVLSVAGPAQATDLTQGENLALQGAPGVPACAGCHGAKGEGMSAAGFPRLGGTSASYLEEQLEAFASGKRQGTVMGMLASALSPAQRTALVTYFSSQAPLAPPAAAASDSESSQPDTGAWLASRGREDALLPACVQCHGPGGVGLGAAPPLAGESSEYIAQELRDFKTGARPGGPLNVMATVAAKLSDTDITAVAHYFAASIPEEAPN